MDQEKRIIIVKEIEQWRRNKLLPEQYCDFLLNLYRNEDTEQNRQPARQAIAESRPFQWLLLFGIIGMLGYVALHFSRFSVALQIAVFLFLVIGLFGISVYLRERKPLLSAVVIGIGSFLMLVGGSLWLQKNITAEWGALAVFLALCSGVWIVFGIVSRFPWLHLCGWIGIMLAYAVAVNRLLAPEGWLALQLAWLPGVVLLGWAGWLLSVKAKAAGAVLLIAACLAWFSPELYAIGWASHPLEIVQWILFGKLAVLSACAFAARKTWIEWVV